MLARLPLHRPHHVAHIQNAGRLILARFKLRQAPAVGLVAQQKQSFVIILNEQLPFVHAANWPITHRGVATVIAVIGHQVLGLLR